jgi:hypothetical protein
MSNRLEHQDDVVELCALRGRNCLLVRGQIQKSCWLWTVPRQSCSHLVTEMISNQGPRSAPRTARSASGAHSRVNEPLRQITGSLRTMVNPIAGYSSTTVVREYLASPESSCIRLTCPAVSSTDRLV